MDIEFQPYLKYAKRSIKQYDIGEVWFNEQEELGDSGTRDYRMVKFYAESKRKTEKFLVNVHEAFRGNIQEHYDTIRSHLLWLEALSHDTLLTVQRPVINCEGNLLTEIEPKGSDTVVVTVLHWVEGDEIEQYSLDIVSHLGRVLAHLHQQASQWAFPHGFTRPSSQLGVYVKRLQQIRTRRDEGWLSTANFAVIEQVANQVQSHIDELGQSGETWGLIHGNFFGNYVLYQGDIRPIDFDCCCFDYYMSELGWFFVDSHFAYRNRIPHFCQAFVDGYNHVLKLTEGDKKAIESFFIGTVICWLSWELGDLKVIYGKVPQFIENACQKYLNDESFLFDFY